MKRTLFHVVRSADRALLGRADHRTVLVDGRTPMNYAMIAPIHRVMAADVRVDFYFTASADPQDGRQIFREAGADARIISPRRASFLRFDAYLTSDLTWATLPRGASRVQMFHGVAGKFSDVYDAPTASMRQWDRLFFVNARRLRNFVSSGAVDSDSPALRLIGMPKIDCLVDGSLQRDEILTGLRLDPALPTVLYAPTWTPHSSLNLLGDQLVDRLADLPINVIVKLHDRSLHIDYEYSGGVDWIHRLTPLLPTGRGVLATRADVSPYLAAADVMITDHSSAGFEYLLRDRPLIRVHAPNLIRHSRIAPEYISLMAEAAATVTTVDETVKAVERALAEPADRSASRRAVAADLFFRPGTATYRAVQELYNVIELPAPVTLTRLNLARDARPFADAPSASL
jgi:CDP-glycerol glycerophosphotransferase (TagB/SpsB family)